MSLRTSTENVDKEAHVGFVKDAIAEYDDEVKKGNAGVSVGVNETIYNTLFTPDFNLPPLTKALAEQIRTGRLRIYVYGRSRWKDEAHDLDWCRWAQPPISGQIDENELVWHVCEDWQ